jgi:hypothetical protein
MTGKIVPGKEYIFVPRTEDGSLDMYHGRTFVPDFTGPMLHVADGSAVVGHFGDSPIPFFAFSDELVDPEE